jgi:hypothetical protein
MTIDNARNDALIIFSLEKNESEKLFKSGLIELLNHLSPEIYIDDYEDEKICNKQLICSAISLIENHGKYDYQSIPKTADKLAELFQEAQRRGTCIYFFF